MSEVLVDVLAAIHAVDYDAVGLGEFGRPDGFLERQVRRWGEQWERSKTRELPEVDELARRLRAALPESGPPTIVHGDYRLDNTMMASDDPGTIVAVLDWEMSTLGDPLADLGLFLLYWGRADAQVIATGDGDRARRPGSSSRDEVVERYARVSGRPVDAARLVPDLRGLQARDHRRGHQRPVPDGQDPRRGLRRDGRDGLGADQRRARPGERARRSPRCAADPDARRNRWRCSTA